MKFSIKIEARCDGDKIWRRLVNGALPNLLNLLAVDENARIVEYGLRVRGVKGRCRAWYVDDAIVVKCELQGLLAKFLVNGIRRRLEHWLRGLVQC